MNKQQHFSIEELTADHSDWQEFVTLVKDLDQYRRQGIGTALQEYTLKQAKLFDCYQVRSVSGENHPENHHLKLAMGFAVEPMERDEKCVAFVMPLKSTKRV